MNAIERDIMTGMVRVLNDIINIYDESGVTIMTKEQFLSRLEDLVQLEAETGVVLLNSPNCAIDVRSIVNILKTKNDRLKEYQDVNDIIEFSNQKELFAYVDVDGLDMIVTYENGYIKDMQIESVNNTILESVCALSVPCCNPEIVDCSIKGKLVISDRPVFYVTEILNGDCNTFQGNLHIAKDLGFDTVPNWKFSTINQKSFQSSIDYIFENAEEDEIPCNGVVFKFNDIGYAEMMSVMGNGFYDGIIYKRKEELDS